MKNVNFVPMRWLPYYILIIISLCIYSCSENNAQLKRLKRIETIMNDNPYPSEALDSILSFKINPESDPAVVALYNLLYSEILLKNYLPVEDTRKLDSAITYFTDIKDYDHLAEAYLYKADILLDNRSFQEAMRSVLKSQYYSSIISDTLLLARDHRLIAQIYYKTYHSKQALDHYRKSADLFLSIGDSLSYHFLIINIGTVLAAINQPEEALSHMYEYNYLKDSDIKSIKAFYNHTFADIYYSMDNFEKAKDIYLASKDNPDYPIFSITDLDCLINCYINIGNIDSAIIWNNYADTVFKDYYSHYKVSADAIILKNTGHYKDALDKYIQYQSMSDSIVSDVLKGSIEETVSTFYTDIANINEKKAEKFRKYSIISALILIILLISILYMRSLHAKKLIKNELIIHEIQDISRSLLIENTSLKSELEIQKEQLSSYSDAKRISLRKNLFGETFQILNDLCEEYYAESSKTDKKRGIILKISEIIKKITQESSVLRIIDDVNTFTDNLLFSTYSIFPSISLNDKFYLALLFAGCNYKTVCVLTNITQTNYYTKRQRYRKQIADSLVSLKIS